MRRCAWVVLTVCLSAGPAGCGGDPSGGSDASLDGGEDASSGGDTETSTGGEAPCELLFGAPNENTGLTEAECVPWCDCQDLAFSPPEYTEADIQEIEALELENPFSELTDDPYASPEQHVPVEGTWCGAIVGAGGTYRLETYESLEALEAAGSVATHQDACGLCSPFADLAVYMRIPDLTEPVRQCGIDGMTAGEEANMACLMELGFDRPCAEIWYYNTVNTRTACLDVCMAALDQPYNDTDGSLNDCLECDEAESGEVFKAVAGRTRRNTGLPTSMCRPCSEVVPIVHDYL